MEMTTLARFMNVPLKVEALIQGPSIPVRELLALKAGSVIETALPAGENVNVHAGQSLLGAGELAASRGKVVMRILGFRGEE